MSADPACACFGAPDHANTPAPGLTRIPWRLSTWAGFHAAMTGQIHRQPGLARLTTRDPSDPAIALLDAWAVSLDVLAFYNERTGNEGFLRPATERRSVLELARLIAYAPAPGVSASTWLAVQCDTIPGSPPIVTLPQGSGVMSIPGPDEKPQIFETDAAIAARPAWQDLRAESVRYVAPHVGDSAIQLFPPTNLRVGDMLLIVGDERRADAQSGMWQARRVAQVDDVPADPLNQLPPRTTVMLESALGAAATVPVHHPRVYAMRQRASLFGHNAPAWEALPLALRVGEFLPLAQGSQMMAMKMMAIEPAEGAVSNIISSAAYGDILSSFTDLVEVDGTASLLPGAYASRRTDWADTPFPATRDYIDLDQVYDRFVAGSWVVLRAGTTTRTYEVTEASEISVNDYGMSAKVTRLKLRGPALSVFTPRSASVYGVSDPLDWGMTPVTTPVTGREVTLSTTVAGLVPGQRVALTAKDAASGVATAQILMLETVTQVPAGGDAGELAPPVVQTARLRFTSDFATPLAPASIRINANVVGASHGETREDVIGSGVAATAFQAVLLPQKPLTFTSVAGGSGRASSLRLRIGASWWNEVPNFLAARPRDRVFATRTADDGTVTVLFGDGITGARPPSGRGNLVARYRSGTGLAGMLAAGQLSQPLQRPTGLAGVVNPLAASGGADPETLASARTSAPVTVRAMGRIVSLADVADFARTFAGIGKADATLVRDGNWRSVVLTIADTVGNVPAASDPLFANLEAAITSARSGGDFAGQRHGLPITIKGFRPATFALSASLVVDAGAVTEGVLTAARAALLDRFGFAARSFGQPASLAEVSAVLHGVAGVRAAMFAAFHRTGASGVAPVIAASAARREGNAWRAAELLTLDPATLTLTEVV